MKRFVVIAMDSQGNVDLRDGQEFASHEVAQQIANGMNAAAGPDHDWFYMSTPADVVRED